MDKELMDRELRGFYRTGCFHIYLAGSFDMDMDQMSQTDLGLFLHEYVHYLQSISTPYGIFEAAALNDAVVDTFREILPKEEIELPYDVHLSPGLEGRLQWLEVMSGQPIMDSDYQIRVDDTVKIDFRVLKRSINDREGNVVCLKYFDQQEHVHYRFIGARDIKESMAAAYQSLIDPNAVHPDIPYNLLRLFCRQEFPSVGSDIKKYICLCYASLFSLEPGFHFLDLCYKAEEEKEKSGFAIFDEYLSDHNVIVNGRQVTPLEHYNELVDKYKNSIEGLIRCEMPYISFVLERVKMGEGNVPLLNVINTESLFTVENVKVLVQALGIPYMHAQDRGWFFPTKDGEGASDVVKLVGTTWLYQFLINKDKNTKCVCPLVPMCGQSGTYCYDQPWLERNCPFELMGDEIGLKNKKIVVR